MSQKPKLPHVERNRAKGRWYYYVRFRGVRIARLPSDPEAPEFFEQYAAAMRKILTQPAPSQIVDGSVQWLIGQYKADPEFTSLADKTRTSYARELDRLAPIGRFQASEIKRKHIKAIRDKLAATPRTRQLFGQVCSVLFNFGIRELDLEMLNPAAKMRRDGEAESFASWSVDEMTAFEESAPPVHLMTAYMVGRYTGPRRSDIARLRRNDYNGVTLRIAGNKTNNEIFVRAHSNLRTYLNGLPKTLSLIADDLGRPVTPDRLSKDLRAHLDSIGLNHLHLHGLRHTAGKELAEAGCTPHEIAAVLGHETLQMVEHYTKTAAQKRMAQSAVMKLERRTKTKQDSAKRAAKPR